MSERSCVREAGLTLVELLITVLLAAILLAGLFYMMSGQQRTYSAQVSTLTTQENLWGAMEYLKSQVRQAGLGFGTCGADLRVGLGAGDAGAGTTWRALDVHNDTNRYRTALSVTEPAWDQTDSLSVRMAAIAPTTVDAGVAIMRLVQQNTHFKAAATFADGPASSTNLAFQNGDLVVFCEPGSTKWASVLQLTAAPQVAGNRWQLQHTPGGSPYNPPGGHSHFPPGGYEEGALIMRLGSPDAVRHFAIDNTREPPTLVTWTGRTGVNNLEVVARGVEDMQIAYGCRPTAGGMPAEQPCTGSPAGTRCSCQLHSCSAKQTDDWAFNVQSDTPPVCDITRPITRVRITLIGRTVGPIVGDREGFRPEAEDHYAGVPSDDLTATGGVGTYGRTVLVAEIKPRNIVPPP